MNLTLGRPTINEQFMKDANQAHEEGHRSVLIYRYCEIINIQRYQF